MTQKIIKTLALLYFIFITQVNAAQEIDVPTSVQVFDEKGRTTIVLPDPVQRTKAVIKNTPLPPACIQLFVEFTVEKPTFVLSPVHPLRTRLESQYAQLRRDVEHLRVSHILSGDNERLWKNALLHLDTPSMSFLALTCGKLLAIQDTTHDDVRDALLRNIESTLEGLLYGLNQTHISDVNKPVTLQEAFYAGDVFILSHPNIISLSFTPEEVSFNTPVPVKFFGIWAKEAIIHIKATKDSVEVAVPWWGFGEKDRYEKVFRGVTPQTTNFPGLYLRLEELVTLIP